MWPRYEGTYRTYWGRGRRARNVIPDLSYCSLGESESSARIINGMKKM